MREILFRGKRIDNGEWVYGYLAEPNVINVEVKDDSTCFLTYDDYEVNPETVGQFTGLTDKLGARIFEGCTDDHGNVVEMVNGSWCLNGDRPLYAFNFVIAGNVHEPSQNTTI